MKQQRLTLVGKPKKGSYQKYIEISRTRTAGNNCLKSARVSRDLSITVEYIMDLYQVISSLQRL